MSNINLENKVKNLALSLLIAANISTNSIAQSPAYINKVNVRNALKYKSCFSRGKELSLYISGRPFLPYWKPKALCNMIPRVVSHWGKRPNVYNQGHHMHYGTDLAYHKKEHVKSLLPGTVKLAGFGNKQNGMGGYGKYILIKSGNVETLYAHLNHIAVKPGQKVNAEQFIGKSGTTGNSLGPHLHIGIKINGRYVDPLSDKAYKYWKR